MHIDIDKCVFGHFEVLLFAVTLNSEKFTSQLIITDDLGTSNFFNLSEEFSNKADALSAAKLRAEEIISKFKKNRALFKEHLIKEINSCSNLGEIQLGDWGKSKNDFLESKLSLDLFKITSDKKLRGIIRVPREKIWNLDEISSSEQQICIQDAIKKIADADWEVLQLFV